MKEYPLILEEMYWLNPTEKRILYLRFWQQFTLEETGKKLGCTRSRIHQLEMRAIWKSKRPRNKRQLFTIGELKQYEGRLNERIDL